MEHGACAFSATKAHTNRRELRSDTTNRVFRAEIFCISNWAVALLRTLAGTLLSADEFDGSLPRSGWKLERPMKPDLRKNPLSLGQFLIDGVQDIDRRCCKIVDGVECGLTYIREQFGEQALTETGKKHTEELLVSWLLQKRLGDAGIEARLEQHYPGSRDRCDLVIRIDDSTDFAVEVKHAWKKWIWCDGSIHRSSNFVGYLLGDATHKGTAHDFSKLAQAAWARRTWQGVLLIGFDSFASPMDDKVEELERQGDLVIKGWTRAAERAWPDRKNGEYRFASWFWARPPAAG